MRWSLIATLLLGLLVLAGARSAAQEQPRFTLQIENGRLVAGQAHALRVTVGDRVTLHWSTDREAVVHLHGYDLEAAVAPGQPATMTFPAHATGRFAIELHQPGGRHRTLGHLEVHPR